jgi:hypothetical protein
LFFQRKVIDSEFLENAALYVGIQGALAYAYFGMRGNILASGNICLKPQVRKK